MDKAGFSGVTYHRQAAIIDASLRFRQDGLYSCNGPDREGEQYEMWTWPLSLEHPISKTFRAKADYAKRNRQGPENR